MANCFECRKPIVAGEGNVFKDAATSAHYCCFLRYVAQTMEDNQFAFDIVGMKLTARQVFEKSFPESAKCNHV